MGVSAIQALVGQTCWYVSAGGVSAPSFTLVLGDRVLRETPLSNPAHPEAFRKFRGTVELLVWCSWRLQGEAAVLASSAQEEAGLPHLDALVGATVAAIVCAAPAWDLVLDFSNGLRLQIFCDNVDPNSPASQNWELWAGDLYVSAGPGTLWEEEQPSSQS